MEIVKVSPEEMAASLSAEIEAAEGLLPLTREVLQECFVPFVARFSAQHAKRTPEAGFAVADAAAALAAAVIGHLHMNVSRPGIDRGSAIHEFMGLVEARVLRSLNADFVPLVDAGRKH